VLALSAVWGLASRLCVRLATLASSDRHQDAAARVASRTPEQNDRTARHCVSGGRFFLRLDIVSRHLEGSGLEVDAHQPMSATSGPLTRSSASEIAGIQKSQVWPAPITRSELLIPGVSSSATCILAASRVRLDLPGG
jgi:hypothetical protein